MTFFSLTFLLIFLPASILLYYIAPRRLKNGVLLFLSLAFYQLLEPHFFWWMAACIFFDYGMGCILYACRERRGIRLLALLLSAGKSAAFLWYGISCFSRGQPSAVGIWIYPLSSAGYVLDLYRGEAPFEQNLVDFALYQCFFGRIFLGPYVQYAVIRPQLKKQKLTLTSISTGMVLLVQGIAKKVIVGDNLFMLYQTISAIEGQERTLLSSWLLLLSCMLGMYFIFGGYCDVARGLGHIFSFKMPRNVFFPLHTRCIREFVERFNISWMDYLRRHVFFSPFWTKGGVLRQCAGVLCMLLYGAWLCPAVNGILWGAYLAAFILLEKYLFGGVLRKLPDLLGRIYTWFVLLLSFTLLVQPSLVGWRALLKTMFHFEAGLWYNDIIAYILSQNYWVLALGLLLSYPVMSRASSFLRKRWPVCVNIFSVVSNLGLVALTIMFLI